MWAKSLGTCVLLVGLLLVASTSAYADTISITSVTLSNLQIIPTSGTVVFSTPQSGSPTSASGAAANSLEEQSSDSEQDPVRSEANTSITFASAGGLSDLTNMLVSANGNVMLSNCVCLAETEGLASLRQTFMIVGGTGNVDVNFLGLLQTVQNLATDEFSLFAASEARITLEVVGIGIFSFDSSLRIGPNASTLLQTQRQLSEVLTLQFGQQYTFRAFVGANSRAGQSEVPEPATIALLISGLGLMAGRVRRIHSS